MGWLYRKLFGLSPREADFERRGFPALDSPNRGRLEEVGRSFISGYNAALASRSSAELAEVLERMAPDLKGFAYEGAGMALMILDLVLPWEKGGLHRFLEGPGSPHIYMLHVGAGWALARLRRNPARVLPRFDARLGWLMMDGYGFHEGYFRWRRYIAERKAPPRLSGYFRRAFDQGLGRSLWFVAGAEPDRVIQAVQGFPAERQPDLWAGVGLASAYAGGVSQGELDALLAAAGPAAGDLFQGAAFAAVARDRAGNMAPQTERACWVYGGCTAEEAAALVHKTGAGLPADGPEPAFEIWRQRIREQVKEAAER